MNRMPVLFSGHGSPMNAIEDNQFTAQWEALGSKLPRPEAILSVSAHWFTPGTKVSDAEQPKMVYDMYGFPKALYEIVYAAPGSPRFAHAAKELIGERAEVDNSWGLDHGTWSVLHKVYPRADIPVFQLSVDRSAPPAVHYQIGQALKPLRDQGVLIFGSGNIVHNLARVNWNMEGGLPWAQEFDAYIKQSILAGEHDKAVRFQEAGPSAKLAVPLMDHYAPLLYVLGASEGGEPVYVYNDACVMGSLSMTGYLIG